MITPILGNYIIILGIISIIIWLFNRQKFRLIFLLIGIGLLGSRIAMSRITILIGKQKTEDYLVLKKEINYTFKNDKTECIFITNNTIINNTPEKLVIEEVIYGNSNDNASKNNLADSIEPYSSKTISVYIHDYYKDPPGSVKVTGNTGNTIRYWLHKK